MCPLISRKSSNNRVCVIRRREVISCTLEPPPSVPRTTDNIDRNGQRAPVNLSCIAWESRHFVAFGMGPHWRERGHRRFARRGLWKIGHVYYGIYEAATTNAFSTYLRAEYMRLLLQTKAAKPAWTLKCNLFSFSFLST